MLRKILIGALAVLGVIVVAAIATSDDPTEPETTDTAIGTTDTVSETSAETEATTSDETAETEPVATSATTAVPTTTAAATMAAPTTTAAATNTYPLVEAIEFETGPLTISLEAVSILPVSALDEFDAAMVEESTQSILVFEDMAFTNTGDRSIEVFPGQGSIVFDGQQYETLGILGDSIGEIADGATVTGDIGFELPVPAEEAATVGEVRLRVDAPFDAETFDAVGEDIDFIATWR